MFQRRFPNSQGTAGIKEYTHKELAASMAYGRKWNEGKELLQSPWEQQTLHTIRLKPAGGAAREAQGGTTLPEIPSPPQRPQQAVSPPLRKDMTPAGSDPGYFGPNHVLNRTYPVCARTPDGRLRTGVAASRTPFVHMTPLERAAFYQKHVARPTSQPPAGPPPPPGAGPVSPRAAAGSPRAGGSGTFPSLQAANPLSVHVPRGERRAFAR
eukprot:TRINITY_DN5453_c0_g1_i1.p1 TRINITY_DN5453_c0_g1~~TRINITY_DN5453_c0_g1_i1.p1  ORF type:complete len:242 (+),score=39.15 TRINITY_DN5453_c0_g1_i1:95-727(+)